MVKDGRHIPFETLPRIHGDKVPRYRFELSVGEYQPQAHNYDKVLVRVKIYVSYRNHQYVADKSGLWVCKKDTSGT